MPTERAPTKYLLLFPRIRLRLRNTFLKLCCRLPAGCLLSRTSRISLAHLRPLSLALAMILTIADSSTKRKEEGAAAVFSRKAKAKATVSPSLLASKSRSLPSLRNLYLVNPLSPLSQRSMSAKPPGMSRSTTTGSNRSGTSSPTGSTKSSLDSLRSGKRFTETSGNTVELGRKP